MKMVECMEDEVPARPKGETKTKVTQKNQTNPSHGNKGHNKCKWAKVSWGFKMTRRNQ